MCTCLSRGRALSLLVLLFLTTSLNVLAQGTKKGTKSQKVKTDSLKTIKLDEVKVTANRLLFVTKQDTISYKLDALKLKSGAMLGDAVSKIPGMSIKDGKLYFNGQVISRIMVNGFDFMKGDPAKVLGILPAYLIKDLKTYESQTEASKQKGYDDGERERVVNLSVKKKYFGTWTGQLTGLGGYKNLYAVEGFANTFADKFRFSVFNNSNNISRQKWFSGSGAVTNGDKNAWGRYTFHAPGMTFLWRSEAEKYKAGYLLVEGSGDYNIEDGLTIKRVEKDKYLKNLIYFNSFKSHNNSLTHRLALHTNIEYAPTDKSFLSYNANFENARDNQSKGELSATWNENPFDPERSTLDSLDQNYRLWKDRFSASNFTRLQEQAKEENMQFSHRAFFRQNFAHGFTMNLSNHLFYSKRESDQFSLTDYKYMQNPSKDELMNRYRDGHFVDFNQQSHLRLSKEFKHWAIRLNYNFRSLYLQNHTLGYRLDRLGSAYADYLSAFDLLGRLPEAQKNWRENSLEYETSILKTYSAYKHRFTPRFVYKGKAIQIRLIPRITFNHDALDYKKGNFETLHISRNRWSFNPTLSFAHMGTELGTIRCSYTLGQRFPSLESQITYPNLENPLLIRLGNPKLKDAYTHSMSFYYYKLFHQMIQGKKYEPILSVYLRLFSNKNTCTQKTAYDPTSGVTTQMPVNTAYHSGNFHLMMMLPLDLQQRYFLSTTFSTNQILSDSYAVAGRLEDTALITNLRSEYSLRLSPQLRLPDLNLTLSYDLDYNILSSESKALDGRAMMTNALTAQVSWQLPYEIHLNCSGGYQHYKSYRSKNVIPNRTIISCSLEKAFLEDKNLILSFKANDLLNQNKGLDIWNTDDSKIRQYSNNLGRYFLFGLSYRFSFASDKK